MSHSENPKWDDRSKSEFEIIKLNTRITELEAKLASCERERDSTLKAYFDECKISKQLVAKLAHYREALQFYACPENWEYKVIYRCDDGCCTNYSDERAMMGDMGDTARHALRERE